MHPRLKVVYKIYKKKQLNLTVTLKGFTEMESRNWSSGIASR